jgi:hypothetical protein
MEIIVSTIISLCGITVGPDQLTVRDLQCIDHFNNCIVDKGPDFTDEDIIQCVKEAPDEVL